MSVLTKANVEITQVIPDVFKAVAKDMAKKFGVKYEETKNGVNLNGGSYDNRMIFKWADGGTEFEAQYDSTYKKEHQEKINKVVNGYQANLAMTVAKEMGFETQSAQEENGDFYLVFEGS